MMHRTTLARGAVLKSLVAAVTVLLAHVAAAQAIEEIVVTASRAAGVAADMLVAPGHNHATLVLSLGDTSSALTAAMLEMIGG